MCVLAAIVHVHTTCEKNLHGGFAHALSLN